MLEELTKIGFAATRQEFKSKFEDFLVGAMGEYAKIEVSEANNYQKYIQHWRDEVERLLFIEAAVKIRDKETKTDFDKRKALEETVGEYNSIEKWKRVILTAKHVIAARYLKNPKAKLKTPDLNSGHAAFWHMVNEALDLAFMEVEDEEE